MGKRKKYFIPAPSLEGKPEKMQNGKDYDSHMVGAYYGSSVEVSVTYSITKSNGQVVECIPDTGLQEALSRKLQHGEFAALKSETQSILPDVVLTKSIMEVQTLEEATQMRQTIDRYMVDNAFARQLYYYDRKGQKKTYNEIMMLHASHRAHNAQIQEEKKELIRKAGAEPVFVNKHFDRPKYSEELLDALKEKNRQIYSPTGYWLQLTFSVIHTIAKNSGYLTGSLSQDELDEMASLLDYKETKSYWRGSIRKNRISIPVQSVDHVRQIVNNVRSNSPIVKGWPESVIKTKIVLERE